MTTQQDNHLKWSRSELVAFAVIGAIIGSLRFSAVGAVGGACLGVVANLVVAYLNTNPTPLAFFVGFAAIGPPVGLVIPLDPQEGITRWQAILAMTLVFAIVGVLASIVVWIIRLIVRHNSPDRIRD